MGILGDIVAVPTVRHARDRPGSPPSLRSRDSQPLAPCGPDGTNRAYDAVIWCTGFGRSSSATATGAGRRPRRSSASTAPQEMLSQRSPPTHVLLDGHSPTGIGRVLSHLAEQRRVSVTADSPSFCEASPQFLRRPLSGAAGNRTPVLERRSRSSPGAVSDDAFLSPGAGTDTSPTGSVRKKSRSPLLTGDEQQVL